MLEAILRSSGSTSSIVQCTMLYATDDASQSDLRSPAQKIGTLQQTGYNILTKVLLLSHPLFRQIRSSLDDAMAASVASALVSSCLDQMNSVFYCTALKHTARLQRVQRALARVVVN